MDQTNNETITSIWFKDSSERDTVFQILSSTVSNKHLTINKKAPSLIAIHWGHDEESKIRVIQQHYKEDTSIHLLSNLDLTSKTRTKHQSREEWLPIGLTNGNLLNEWFFILLGLWKDLRKFPWWNDMAETTRRAYGSNTYYNNSPSPKVSSFHPSVLCTALGRPEPWQSPTRFRESLY